jgi:hypothetical protein
VLGILTSRSKISTGLDHDIYDLFAAGQLHVAHKVYLSSAVKQQGVGGHAGPAFRFAFNLSFRYPVTENH